MQVRSAGLMAALILLGITPGVAAQKKTKPRAKSPQTVIAELKGRIKTLDLELEKARAEVKSAVEGRAAAEASLQKEGGTAEQIASLKASRDLARQEADTCRKELESLKAQVQENAKGQEGLLSQVRKAEQAKTQAEQRLDGVQKELEALQAQGLGSKVADGSLVPLGMDITPARPINLSRVTPSAPRGVRSGIVVVNVLVSEKGDALEVRLLQGLPDKDSEAAAKAHELCLEAAKRLVFDPARTTEGQVRVKVWQGVGFHLD